MSRGVVASINQSALRHNLEKLRGYTTSSVSILAMIKANAYGHGVLAVARALDKADGFGVAEVEQAVTL